MIAKVSRGFLAVWILLIFISASWDVFAGSKASQETANESSSSKVTNDDPSVQLSGQELWSMNCQRCHNMRSPAMYSDAQWEIIVHHMRIRANLTGADQRAITDFLKSASR